MRIKQNIQIIKFVMFILMAFDTDNSNHIKENITKVHQNTLSSAGFTSF
jgi:hypothetical protein